MAYIKQTWQNNPPSTATPLNATRLNHLETQYDEAVALMGDNDDLLTTAKSTLVSAINEVYSSGGGGGGVEINDGAINTTQTWSSQKSNNEINAALGSITAQDISNSTATGRSLITASNAASARTTLDVWSKVEIGNPEIDLVAIFEAAIA